MNAANRRAIFLDEIGVGPRWTRRSTPVVDDQVVDADTQPEALLTFSKRDEISRMNWAQLKAVVADCVECGLCRNRTQTVFGVGDEKAKWLFVGEGPGHEEDLQGEPFVGPSGKLLDNMLLAMGLRRGENAYITNIVKCRATDANGVDRAPTLEEAASCRPYLDCQIALLQPSIIVALGKTAALSLLNSAPDTSVADLRGSVHRYSANGDRTIPLVVTYHPAYLLRRLEEKGQAWADLCLALDAYASVAV